MAVESGDLSQPLLNVSKSYEEEHRNMIGSLQTGKHGLLAAAAAHTGLSYSRTRTLLRQRQRRNASEPGTESVLWKSLMWPITKIMEIERIKTPAALPVKAGLAALLAGLLCFAPGALSPLNKNGVWAVVTADIVLETNVGLTLSKGLNRTLGTLLAAALAMGVVVLGMYLGSYENYFLLVCTFLGGAVPTMFKFREPFKDRWNYAVVMSMITFHLLILSQSDRSAKFKLPLVRFGMIVIGFLIAVLVNILVLPNFAGNNVNNLLATNFERAGNVVEKCVEEYCKGTVLADMPHVLSHATNDELHLSFHEIVAAESEVDKLLVAAKSEPPHGKFFFRYPWHMYEEVTESLRFSMYDVVALDSCLRAEIQAPLNLRALFRMQFLALGKECADVFQALGKTMRNMERIDTQQIMERAEEVAILLQHNIAKHADILLQGAPCPGPAGTPLNENTPGFLAGVFNNPSAPSETTDDNSHPETVQEDLQIEQRENQIEKSLERKSHRLEGRAGEFLKRKSSIAEHWDATVQRLAALSLIKFSSTLIEITARAKFLASIVDDLAVKAKFDISDLETSKSSPEFEHIFGNV
ncbi:unnamed protein product [Sphagnum troendelagicum]|uniref:Aluminum-activated malate transporter n=1 Tax=Sphagnum troendelagicum TaxID=128251 RepID=A0ABP0UZZ5_9BRYO